MNLILSNEIVSKTHYIKIIKDRKFITFDKFENFAEHTHADFVHKLHLSKSACVDIKLGF